LNNFHASGFEQFHKESVYYKIIVIETLKSVIQHLHKPHKNKE